MREIAVFDAADDCPHEPTSDPGFQESSLFVWHDLEAGIGGFWRLGQEPVISELNSCFGMFTAEGQRFRSNVTGVPMLASDRGETYMAWGDRLRIDLDTLAIKADFPECEASLTFEDFFPRYVHSELINSAQSAQRARQQHFEVAGRMRGQVRIGGREFNVDALGYRDRSWGLKRWGKLRSTRWWPAVFGPDLCVHTIAVVDEEGYYGHYGYAIRDGVPLAMTEAEVLCTLEADAVSPRAGTVRFTLENGETGELEHTTDDGVVLFVRGYTAVEAIGKVRWGDRTGMSLLEVCTNPTGGLKPPVFTLGANNHDGLSQKK